MIYTLEKYLRSSLILFFMLGEKKRDLLLFSLLLLLIRGICNFDN